MERDEEPHRVHDSLAYITHSLKLFFLFVMPGRSGQRFGQWVRLHLIRETRASGFLQ